MNQKLPKNEKFFGSFFSLKKTPYICMLKNLKQKKLWKKF